MKLQEKYIQIQSNYNNIYKINRYFDSKKPKNYEELKFQSKMVELTNTVRFKFYDIEATSTVNNE